MSGTGANALIVFEDYVQGKESRNSSWKKFYVVLSERAVYMYNCNARSTMSAAISLSDIFDVKRTTEYRNKKKPFALIALTSQREYAFAVKTEEELDKWLSAFEKAMSLFREHCSQQLLSASPGTTTKRHRRSTGATIPPSMYSTATSGIAATTAVDAAEEEKMMEELRSVQYAYGSSINEIVDELMRREMKEAVAPLAKKRAAALDELCSREVTRAKEKFTEDIRKVKVEINSR
eukprot:TRINITY_DN1724_c0_g2_i1.p1 TRINITY_DN1724_c0_g2~~TRINITY_DN1724_c0_g2_i1.p1  ORF type:complete len:235 (+),score=70.76 TRINITY_DN1724_c0_g2_i1:237-941(+)